MDPLDPLTEIIKSGQAFSFAIALERFLWVIIGFFLFGAILKSTILEFKLKDLTWHKSFFSLLKAFKRREDEIPNKISDEKNKTD